MGIGLIEAVQGQTARKVNKTRKGCFLLQAVGKVGIGQLGNSLQICRLIRDQGHKYPVVSGKIPVIHRLKAGGGIVNRSLLHRILQLCQKAILAFVDPVIVLSAKHLHGKQGLCLPEGLPQGELVLGVAFKIGGKASALNGAPGAFRHLRQLSPFRQGLRIGRMEPAGKGQSNIQNGQSPEKSIFLHRKCSLKVKVF